MTGALNQRLRPLGHPIELLYWEDTSLNDYLTYFRAAVKREVLRWPGIGPRSTAGKASNANYYTINAPPQTPKDFARFQFDRNLYGVEKYW